MMNGFETKDINMADNLSDISETDYVFVSAGGTQLKKISYAQLAENMLEEVKIVVNGNRMTVKELLEMYSWGLEIGELD